MANVYRVCINNKMDCMCETVVMASLWRHYTISDIKAAKTYDLVQ